MADKTRVISDRDQLERDGAGADLLAAAVSGAAGGAAAVVTRQALEKLKPKDQPKKK